MKKYKNKMSMIMSFLLSLPISKPIVKSYKVNTLSIDIISNNEMCLDLYENKNVVCLDLNLYDDDLNQHESTAVPKENKVKAELHSVIDSFTNPYKLCYWLANSLAMRGVSNAANIFIFDTNLKKNVLKEAETSTKNNSTWEAYEKELKKIYSGLGWIDHRESGIKSRTCSTLYNYLDYVSYLVFSKIKDIGEISYKRIMDDKNATNWVYTLAWNHILKTLGFATKIYKIKSDEIFFNQEYVIVFAKRLDGNTKIHLLTPFLAKKTNEVDKLFSEKVPEGILENSINNEIVLEDVDNSSDTIKLKIGKSINNYFDYNEDNKSLSKKEL